MMWKPTKPGYYRFGNDCRDVWVDRAVMMTREAIHGDSMPVAEGPWSLMGPDWQPGAPTVGQLALWQWWAMVHESRRVIYCGEVRAGVFVWYVGAAKMGREFITRSAPIQPDLSNGPLWVPLEVANG